MDSRHPQGEWIPGTGQGHAGRASSRHCKSLKPDQVTRGRTKQGKNTFRVEARLLESHDRLRPGMKGVAKIEIGPRRKIWIWTHEAFDWLRLALWNWMP